METRDRSDQWQILNTPERSSTPDHFEMVESPEIKTENPPVHIQKIARPAKHLALSDLTLQGLLSSDTSHKVYKASLETKDEIISFIYKEVSDNPIMCELEAVAAGLFEMLATSDYIPRTVAVYDRDPETGEEKCVGVASEEIIDFKPLAKDPVTEEDLDLAFINKRNLTITELEKLDIELRILEREKLTLLRKLKKQQEIKKNIQLRLTHLDKTASHSQTYLEPFVTGTITNNRRNTFDILDIEEKQVDIKRKITEFEEKLSRDYRGLTLAEFNRFRISKGLGTTFAACYILMEEDFHKNNLDKFGRHFDCDMKLWELYHLFKTRDAISALLSPREPGFHTSVISAYDIEHFPNLRDCKPGYWPPNEAPVIGNIKLFSDSIRAMTRTIKSNLNIRINDYTEEENTIFKTLEFNPVFRHYSNALFCKFILTHKQLFQDITQDHLYQHYRHTFKEKNDYLSNHIIELMEHRRCIFQQKMILIQRDEADMQMRLIIDRYNKMHELILTAMDNYKNKGGIFSTLYSFWHTHTELAEKIIKKCQTIQRNIQLGSESNYINAMAILYKYIHKKLAIFEKDKTEREAKGELVKPGGMHITLANLANDLDKIILPEVSLAVILMEQLPKTAKKNGK